MRRWKPSHAIFAAHGYALCVVNTGGDHGDLTDDYAAIRTEMEAVAAHFGKKVLREVAQEDVENHIGELRKACGDRAVLRALHFYDENARVLEQAAAIRGGDLPAFFDAVKLFGREQLEAVSRTRLCAPDRGTDGDGHRAEPPFPRGDGAQRVHGGGFAGTIQGVCAGAGTACGLQAFDGRCGAGSCTALMVRPEGGHDGNVRRRTDVRTSPPR